MQAHDQDPGNPGALRSIPPQEVRRLLHHGEAQLLDLRTELERRRYGAPPGTISVSLARHILNPEGGAVSRRADGARAGRR